MKKTSDLIEWIMENSGKSKTQLANEMGVTRVQFYNYLGDSAKPQEPSYASVRRLLDLNGLCILIVPKDRSLIEKG